jgi:hypothetical protein
MRFDTRSRQSSGAPPWSIRNWLAHHVGCRPAQLHIVARAGKGTDATAVTYEGPTGERLTVIVALVSDDWRISTLQGDRWLRADVQAGRGLLW